MPLCLIQKFTNNIKFPDFKFQISNFRISNFKFPNFQITNLKFSNFQISKFQIFKFSNFKISNFNFFKLQTFKFSNFKSSNFKSQNFKISNLRICEFSNYTARLQFGSTKNIKLRRKRFHMKDTGKSSSRKLRRVVYNLLYRMDPQKTHYKISLSTKMSKIQNSGFFFFFPPPLLSP